MVVMVGVCNQENMACVSLDFPLCKVNNLDHISKCHSVSKFNYSNDALCHL